VYASTNKKFFEEIPVTPIPWSVLINHGKAHPDGMFGSIAQLVEQRTENPWSAVRFHLLPRKIQPVNQFRKGNS
jgi:hypothetical protein